MAFESNQYADLLNTTFPSAEYETWAEQVWPLQNYHVMSRLTTGSLVKQHDSGEHIQFNARFVADDQARAVLIREAIDLSDTDMHQLGSVPWREDQVPCLFDEQIIDQNRGNRVQLVDLLKSKRNMAKGSLANLLESQFFQGPTSLADNRTFHGLPVWVPKGTGTTFSFENNDPDYVSGGAGGFASATYENWRSGFSQYVNVDDDDLYEKMRVGLLETGWNPPVGGPYSTHQHEKVSQGYYTTMQKREILTVQSVVLKMEQQARTQNDQIGPDLNAYAGKVPFYRSMVTWVAWLTKNADATANSSLHGIDPVYGITWDDWEFAVLRGNLFGRIPAERHPQYKRTWVELTYLVGNFVCHQRRSQFLLSKANT